MSMRHVFRKRFRARRVVPLLWPGRLLNAASLLLERDQVRARERHGIWLQGLVRQVRIAGIQDIIKPDGRLVVAAGRGCIHRNDDGVIVRHRSDRRVRHRTTDLPADHDEPLDALRLQLLVEIGIVEPVLGRVGNPDVARGRRDLFQPLGLVLRSRAVGHGEARPAYLLHEWCHGRQHLGLATDLVVADVLNIIKYDQSGGLGIERDVGRVGGRRHLQGDHFGGGAIGRLRFSSCAQEREGETARKDSAKHRHFGISLGL